MIEKLLEAILAELKKSNERPDAPAAQPPTQLSAPKPPKAEKPVPAPPVPVSNLPAEPLVEKQHDPHAADDDEDLGGAPNKVYKQEEIIEIVRQGVATYGRPPVKAFLNKHGGTNATSLDPSVYNAFVADMETLAVAK